MKEDTKHYSCKGMKRASIVLGLAMTLGIPTMAYAEQAKAISLERSMQQQNGQTIKGTVIDEFGEPMIGVTVMAKGTTSGTITDLDGNFTIKAKTGDILQLTYTGYKTQTIKVNGTQLNIKMEPDAIGLDEVVKIGYGTVKKRDLTGAISQVKAEDITQAPTTSAMEGLQGKIAGLDITRESGQAGASPKILLRGNRSLGAFGAECTPLYVIDGIAGGNIEDLNPNDIESIEVMKDASSTAIYGSAGANGVILVTTKQAKAGKTVVDFNAYLGINAFPSYPKTYTGNAWLDFLNEGYAARYDEEYLPIHDPDQEVRKEAVEKLFNAKGLTAGAVEAFMNGKSINWRDEVLNTGMQQNYNISVRGGTDKTKSYMSIGYQQEKGLYKDDQQDQLTFRAGSDFQINKLFKVGFQSNINYKNRNNRQSRLSKTLNAFPIGDVYDENGKLNQYPVADMKNYINILADDQPYAYKNNTKYFGLNIAPYVEFTPYKGFLVKSMLNASFGNTRQGIWDGLDTYMKLSGSQPNVRSAYINNGQSYNYTWQNVMSYSTTLAKNHDIGITAVMEYSKNRNEKSNLQNESFDFDDYLWYSMSGGSKPFVDSNYSEMSKLSYAFRVTYSYLGRYLFSGSMRWDGASQLYKKWDSFPALSFGWRISDESFMESTRSWLDNLKLRVGYGVTGNSNIPAYVSLTNVVNSPNYINLGTGRLNSYILTDHIANNDLTWEKSKNWNIGLDFAVFNGRIDGSVEWYDTKSEDVIYTRPLPTTAGAFNAKTPYKKYSNIARINNQGIEVTLNTRNIQKKDFKWTTTFTYAKNKEALKEINMGNNVTVESLIALNLFMDHPVNTYYGYKKAGIWQLGEEEQAACFGDVPGKIKLDIPGMVWDPDYTYVVETKDQDTGEVISTTEYKGAYYKPAEDNEDGTHNYYTRNNTYGVSTTDKQILGSATPDWTIGLQNKFEYKGFDLTIMATMRWGQMLKGELLGFSSNDNQPTSYDYWTPNNPTNTFPRPNWGGSMSGAQKESMYYVEGSYFKIKNISLGYTLPKKLIQKINVTNLRLYGTLYNPIIISKNKMLKGMDPENNASDKYPLYKTLVFGVNLTF